MINSCGGGIADENIIDSNTVINNQAYEGYGGICIFSWNPDSSASENILTNNVGYPPEFGSQEGATSSIWAEALAETADDFETLTPFLATSWEEDFTGKTFTVHLRKGVKFHDGTDFNAEAARWNFQLMIDSKRFSLWQAVESIEVLDDYTLKISLNDYPYTETERIDLSL